MVNLEKGFKQFLVKTLVFVGLFILIQLTLLILQNIALPEEYYLILDMDIGKSLLLTSIVFIFLSRDKLKKLGGHKFEPWTAIIFGILGILSFAAYSALKSFLVNNPSFAVENIWLFFPLKELSLILGTFFLFIAVFGIAFSVSFFKKFKKEIGLSIILFILVLFLIIEFQKLWVYLSYITANITYFLLNLTFEPTLRFKGIYPILGIGNFIVSIGKSCSGIDSIFMFIFLYVFIVGYDWKILNKKKAIVLFIPGVLSVFLLNIIRIYSLILIGAFVSREFAIGFFHTTASMVLFLGYFILFWAVAYKWMKKNPGKPKPSKLKIIYNKIINDSLYKNSIYLIFNTIMITGFGFFFWMINTRLYSAENVGLATALISVMNLIAGLSVLGLNIGLIRYLSKAKDKNKKINTSFTLVIISTIIITSIFLMFLKYIAPKLMFVHDNMILSFIFILFMIAASLNYLIESIFTAYRKTKYILFKNTIFSVLKLVFPFFLVFLGAYGIFSSYMISLFIALIVSFIILIIRFNYSPEFTVHNSTIKKIGGYSFGNYIAGFIGGLPLMILPLLILNKLGAEQTAYYYVAMMIAALLFAIPQSTANSLFAEGSHNEKHIKHQIKKAFKIISLLLIPAIIIIIVFGKYLLLFFGKDYSAEGFRFLQVIALSGIFIGINSVFGTSLRVKNRIKSVIAVSIASALLILGLSWIFIDKGLIGVGYAYLIGSAINSLIYLVVGRK